MHSPIKKVVSFGAGYVGTPTMVMMAINNPDVSCVIYDINKDLIGKWKVGCPIYEPGLEESLNLCRDKNLTFTSDLNEALEGVDVIYISVPTPTKLFGEGAGSAYDLSYVESVSRTVAKYFAASELDRDIIVVEKSTVPIMTHQLIDEIIQSNQTIKQNKDRFVVVSNPEFLAEGTIMSDLTDPDRIIFGSARNDIIDRLCQLHTNVSPEKIIRTATATSEMSKLVSNCMLAQRVSSINSISLLCEAIGGDIEDISKCVGLDSRIGGKYLKASVGFGGSCLQKDLLALIYLAESRGLQQVADYWRAVVNMNDLRKNSFFNLLFKKMHYNVKNKKIAIFGMSFKKGTGDVRDSASATIASKLLIEGAVLRMTDPGASRDKFIEEMKYQGLWKESYESRLTMHTPEESVEGAHAIVVMTEWDEFKHLDYSSLYQKMERPAFVFDGRNILSEPELSRLGFKYYRIGQKE